MRSGRGDQPRPAIWPHETKPRRGSLAWEKEKEKEIPRGREREEEEPLTLSHSHSSRIRPTHGSVRPAIAAVKTNGSFESQVGGCCPCRVPRFYRISSGV
ncbi:hypothetical protein PVAP13_5NG170931 [Panicum virgatum]|uniref:Uncharacterized protein n=1 Tax=Panicum virgatum TaxID=38727 RepID=A0A8T0S401_PANVG|nr:hypothetical protein PVAP13_5NG170931 [Panicum virgatum]